ncbi:MAG: multifunctional CCA tRNA nucleotidyl transferase/2'3'-cyclic phosphodiesterase/2'nucleotidase/phosphatase [Proteobacteria bacterium]|nr:multifunctional CCA tRNA nucleotidyl transferase/2'3'-cyclic phosphodiesterase/2'nucleotidase/phosphatase [Pseudomonadota bacterium]
MEIYLVGGAVRDALLGLPVTERDWVVVGATPEEMLKQGFQPVGKDFPVFLHPYTHEEYALARTERKTGKGYKGFTFHSTPEVSLIDDLQRRDLTINAIAQSIAGQLIDPYGGQQDLQQGILKHVSPAFQEDPVRILRVARFAARFSHFQIHPQTMELMRQMVENGEVDALVPERVWQEFRRALESSNPEKFLFVLKECSAINKLFPEILLTGQVLSALQRAVDRSAVVSVRFAVLTHAVAENHLTQFCKRLRIPSEYSDLAVLVSKGWRLYAQIDANSKPDKILTLLKMTDARRRQERFEQFITTCDCITNFSNQDMGKFLKVCIKKLLSIDIQPLQLKELKGQEFASALEQLQLAVIREELARIFPASL